MADEKKAKVKLTGLWKKRIEGNGIEFFTGYIGSAQIEIWPNSFKSDPKHPDYNLFITEAYKKENKDASAPIFNNNDTLPF